MEGASQYCFAKIPRLAESGETQIKNVHTDNGRSTFGQVDVSVIHMIHEQRLLDYRLWKLSFVVLNCCVHDEA